jgi:AcrR family transcriptional regulator
VPADRSSAGDPARTLELLWRDPDQAPAGRGPKQGLTLGEVVRAAIEVADTAGLGAVTMRRVADQLGVAPMSLYTYVPGKAELLDLMLDAVYRQLPRADLVGEPWRARVAAVADENRELFRAHPWVAEVNTVRPPLGPGQVAKFEHELRAFDGLGLDDVTMDAALTFLLGFVQSCARLAHDAEVARRDSAMNDLQWWEANAPLLAKLSDAERYPTAARVGAAAGAAHGAAHDPDHAYRFGLARVLDGLAALIEGRADPVRP